MSLVIARHLPIELQLYIQSYTRPKTPDDYPYQQLFQHYKRYLYYFLTQIGNISPYLYHLAFISQSLHGLNRNQYLVSLYQDTNSNHILLEIGYESHKIDKIVLAHKTDGRYNTYQQYPLHEGWVLALMWRSCRVFFDLTQHHQLNPIEQETWRQFVETVETNIVTYLNGVGSLWGIQYVYW